MIQLDKEDNFITAKELLYEIKNAVPTYFERGIIDDSIFYPHISYCLGLLGLKVYPTGSVVVPIRNYKGQLPYDFYKMVSAVGCFNYVVTSNPDYNNPKLYDVAEEQITNYLISKPSITGKDENGENFYIIQKFEQFSVEYSSYSPLTLSKASHNYCTKDCHNKQQGEANQIEIQKSQGQVITNFETGSIYLEYLQKLEVDTDEGKDILIPDFQQVRKWIKDYCIMELFRYLLNNTTLDIQYRLNLATQQESVSQSNARSFVKRFEFSDLYQLRKLLYSRYTKFHEIVHGPIPYTNKNRIYSK